MRIIACILLITFTATVGCFSTYRWVPAGPQPDATTCAKLVDQRVQVHVAADSTVVMDVERCEWPTIHGWVVEGKTRTEQTVAYDLTEVGFDTQTKSASNWPLLIVLPLVIGAVAVAIAAVIFVWNHGDEPLY